ncbi:MAG: helix-turn-helix domain-containing protein [Acidobacteriota bacterium]
MFERLSRQDHYQVLEVDYRATPEEIKAAYERAKEIYGNESLVSSTILSREERHRILQRVAEAYDTLIAEDSRRLYNQALTQRSPELRKVLNRGWNVGDPRRPSDSAPGTYPRLVKPDIESQPAAPPARPGEGPTPLQESKLQLGIKEEATGSFLRRARESAGLDLRAIAQETKIGVTMLKYIEEERLDRLPVPVYLKNFVSQYARCLGLDDQKVARTYLARIRRLQSKP